MQAIVSNGHSRQWLGRYPGLLASDHVGVPPQPLDALENLPKERPGQVAFGELQREVPHVPDETPQSNGEALTTQERRG